MAVTPYAPGTNASETIGGKEYGRSLLADTAGTDAMGVVGNAPAANTMLGRLKAIADLLGLTTSADRFFDITPGAAALATVPKAITVAAAGTVVVAGSDNVQVTLTFAAGEIKPIRPRYVLAGGTATGIVGLA